MASADTIARLHVTQPEREQFKCPNFGHMEIDGSAPSLLELQERSLSAPVRRRAREACRFTAPDLMSSVRESAPMDRGDALRALAARDFVRALVAQHARRGAGAEFLP
jgi:hypothetical protein